MNTKLHTHIRTRGFALVVVLLLSALLVAMLVALVTATLAETRVVKSTAKVALARAHALKGVQEALGALQHQAGRDQCITVPATLLEPNAVNPWLVAAMPQGLTITSPAWLVSGSAIDRSKDLPEVTAMTNLPDPSRSETRTVWLLRHAVNDDDKLSVKAAKVPIDTSDKRLQQLLGSDLRIGSYAWWVSDESLKAKASLRTQPTGWSGDSARRESIWQLASAPRTAPWKTTDLQSLPKDDPRSDRVLTFDQLPLLAKNSSRLRKDLANYFHDFTAESFGVICDVRKGGLKRDLTLAFEMPEDDFLEDEHFGITHSGLAGDAGIYPRHINWRVLRDYYQTPTKIQQDTLRAQTYTADPLASKPQDKAAATNRFLLSQQILHPVIPTPGDDDEAVTPRTASFIPMVARMQHAVSMMTQDAPDGEEGEGPLKLVVILDPVITYWNPYNIKLSASALRVDDALPQMHVVIEVRQPWKDDKRYSPNDEVYQGGKIYKAVKPNRGQQPPGQNEEWEELMRTWSLASDMTLRQMLQRHGAERASFVLSQEGAIEGAPQEMVFEPGELAVFSLSAKSVEVHQQGELAREMKRSWNPDAGIGFDRLGTPSGAAGGDDGSQFWLRVYNETEVRVTLEPLRRNSKHYEDNDPFEFIKNYKDDPRFTLNDASGGAGRFADGSEGTAYLPFDHVEYLGEFTGGETALASFAWSGTRRGSFIETAYDMRAYTGKDEADARKPLPGMSDPMLVSTHLVKEQKTYFGLSDWGWKTEADVKYPAQPISRFNPRFALNDTAPAVDEKRGYPCAVSHYQLELKRISSNTEIIELDRNFRSFWGPSRTAQGEQQVPLFEVPTAPMISTGQLQHFPTSLSPIDGGYGIGASWPSPFIERTANVMETNDDPKRELVDGSWFVNDKLFDSYFFSSLCSFAGSDGISSRLSAVTSDKGPKLLPNTRLRLHHPPGFDGKEITQVLDPASHLSGELPGYNKAAAFLLIDGPFNVNSTSIEAWKSVLASCDNLRVPAYPSSAQGPSDNVFTRLTVTNGPASDHWRGYRSLTDGELQTLAAEIVVEVKKRGPFKSLAEFVNRQLNDNETGLCGTLQAAIDRSEVNRHLTVKVTDAALIQAAAQHEDGEPAWEFPFPAHATGPVMAGQTGFLQQGDILQSLSPVLTVRGDTFKIRTYGEVTNPRTGALEARAWCEVIVQRMPEYVKHRGEATNETDEGDPPWTPATDLKDEINRELGRNFRVIRLRWLSPDEV